MKKGSESWKTNNKMKQQMKVSLILTTYNCKDNLISTLQSIDRQDYSDIEVVIKDGVSTDGTLDVIREYADEHPNVLWKSGQDAGLYDALNQGIQMATGDIIAICNDLFTVDDAVSRFVNAIEQNPECSGAHSDLIYADGDKIVRYWKMGQGQISQGWMPGHPSLYLKRQVYEKYGLYNTSYKCSADYEFMIRMLKDNAVKLEYIPEVLIQMYYGGTSTGSAGSYITSVREGVRALKSNHVKHALGITILRTIRVMIQFANGKMKMGK